MGNLQWSAMVKDVVEGFRKVFFPDDFVLGGGNVAHLEQLPPDVRRGDNAYAFLGGFRLWENESPELFLGK
jgi:polyphosphate glucokinase